MNKVVLLANLTRDPEVKFTAGNKAVAKLGLAVNERWTDASGERKESTSFIDAEAWGKTAENIGKFFAKGRRILIEGRLKQDQWEDKTSGEKRSKLKVVIDTFHFVDSKPGGGTSERPGPAPSQGSVPVPDGDDIPFD